MNQDQNLKSLTPEELAAFLATENEDVIKELYSLTLQLSVSESDRTKSLDGKAAALFGFIGAFISAVFVVLGLLDDTKGNRLASILAGNVFYCVVLALAALVAALWFLYRCVKVKESWKAPGERDLFEAIHQYDRHVDGDPKNSEKSGHDYRRHLIEHFWKLYRVSFEQNEKKAKDLLYAQMSVFVALILLVAVQIFGVIELRSSIMSNPIKPAQSSAPTPTNSSTPAPSATSGRPAPLPVSSAGRPTNDSAGRPAPLQASSNGSPTRLSEGRPTALPPSGSGSRLTNGSDSKGNK